MIQKRLPLLPVALVCGVLALGACGAAPPPEEEGTAVHTAVGADTSAVLHPLTPDGWGPVRIGMTREEVVAVAGEDADPELVGGPEPEVCDEFRPEEMPEGMLVMIEQGRLTRISVSRDSEVRTGAGLGVGASAEAVEAEYGGRVERSPHQYVEAPAAYLTVWTTPPPGPDARGIVYETGSDGRVSRIHAGGPSIRYVEGCL